MWHAALVVDAGALDGAGDQTHDRIQMTEHRTRESSGDVRADLDLLDRLFQFVAQLDQRIAIRYELKPLTRDEVIFVSVRPDSPCIAGFLARI